MASINWAKQESDNLFSAIKGAVANLFISPPKVAKLGNETMLDFGHALLEQKSAFTFPKSQKYKGKQDGSNRSCKKIIHDKLLWLRRENTSLTDKANLTVNIGENRQSRLKNKRESILKKTGRRKYSDQWCLTVAYL